MKHRLVLVTAILLLLLSAAAFAADTSEFYVKSIPITKVYPHRDGYRIVYRRTNMDLAVLYLPHRWFQYQEGQGNRGQGELVIDNKSSYPYMSIFWKDAEFSHVRLYLRSDKNHLSWGDLNDPESFTDKFDVETLDNIQF